MKFPALDIRGVDADLALAHVDDFGPTAVEDLADGISVYFTSEDQRDQAHGALTLALPDAVCVPRDVDDEDWARRSQQNLMPVSVGRIVVAPPWYAPALASSASAASGGPRSSLSVINVTIAPSMGFGTGHHATTRLCLEALQQVDVGGRVVLDVGTGSGILAIVASLLGARDAFGIDVDADAIASARENLGLNPDAGTARFEVADLHDAPLPRADVVLANLTGATLAKNADVLASAVRAGGSLIVSGLQTHERDAVVAALPGQVVVWSAEEDGWVALTLTAAVASPH